MSFQRLLSSMSAAVFLAAGICPAASAAERPNTVLFLVDDMGWMDCGAYGSQYYETPHIDRFAKQSMRFTQTYVRSAVARRCSSNEQCAKDLIGWKRSLFFVSTELSAGTIRHRRAARPEDQPPSEAPSPEADRR